MTKGDISFYLDTLLIETAFGNPAFIKTAQSSMISGLVDTVKNYFAAHWDPNNKSGSVIDMLAPAAIFMIFRGLGFGKLGWLFGVAASALHLDVDGMISSIYNSVRGSIAQGKSITPSELDSAVNSAIQEHTAPISEQEAEQIGEQADRGQAWDKRNLDKELRDARLVCLALEQYEFQMLQLTKQGQRNRGWFSSLSGTRSAAGSLIGRIIGFVFKIILISAGLMVLGDLTNKILGRPNALDHTWQAGQTPSSENSGNSPQASNALWVEHVANNPNSIEDMLINFAKEVYPNLVGKEVSIKRSPTFQAIKDHIVFYNQSSAGEPEVYLPPNYTDKKTLVDRFVNEVK